MLIEAVRIEQTRPDDGDRWQMKRADHRRQPTPLEYDCVIVEKKGASANPLAGPLDC